YFSIPKLVVLLAVYLCWVSVCSWVDRDAQKLGLSTDTWNPILLGAGLVGLLVVWLLPIFWIGLLILLILGGAAALSYVHVLNQHVPADKKVLTERHFKELATRFLKMKFRPEREDEDDDRVPVRFIGRSYNQQEEDHSRVARAQGSKGYKAALKMVHEAIRRRATDIHLEPTKSEMAVRF